eukprot:jgi/Botrbrau1/1687/Bobra.116_2s0029.2
MIKELKTFTDAWPPEQAAPRVLVPGCGLGRLCLEAAALGCQTEGNEFSYFMLLASNLVLNGAEGAGQWRIFPWVLNSCNQLSDTTQLRSVLIPDVFPAELLPGTQLLSMSAGDMVEVYGGPERAGSYDFVLTCFFIDTSHNIIEYIEVIHNALREGGIWINLGPLLYHWADSHTYLPDEELSIEVSLDDVERISCAMGFRLLRKEMVPTGFNVNLRSMMTSSYRSVFWTMEKDSSLAGRDALLAAVPEAHPAPVHGDHTEHLPNGPVGPSSAPSSASPSGEQLPGGPSGAPAAPPDTAAEARLSAVPDEAGLVPQSGSPPGSAVPSEEDVPSAPPVVPFQEQVRIQDGVTGGL